jgi:hypothetical protein
VAEMHASISIFRAISRGAQGVAYKKAESHIWKELHHAVLFYLIPLSPSPLDGGCGLGSGSFGWRVRVGCLVEVGCGWCRSDGLFWVGLWGVRLLGLGGW